MGLDPQTIGLSVMGGIAAVAALAKFWNWQVFETDERALRQDLLQQIEAERATRREMEARFDQVQGDLYETRSELMRLRVGVDALRHQSAMMIELLRKVREGAIAPADVPVPAMPVMPGEGG